MHVARNLYPRCVDLGIASRRHNLLAATVSTCFTRRFESGLQIPNPQYECSRERLTYKSLHKVDLLGDKLRRFKIMNE